MPVRQHIPHNDSRTELKSDGMERAWRPLHYLNLYRITLAALFVSSIFLGKNLPLLGSEDAGLFKLVSITYLALALVSSFVIHGRWLSFHLITFSLAMVDIIALTLLMRASGG
ncbi:MAG: hypothetical protein GXP17_03015, partial [Gammaproteobacteria bacterium]|nr:hypothetical protein [Gammaproteobacteria bacterium]